MKFSIDLMLGFASPDMKMVKTSPDGIKGWWFKPLWRKMVAPDGKVFILAMRLIGVTFGITLTRECDNSSLPVFASRRPPVAPPAPPTPTTMSSDPTPPSA